VSSWTYGTQVFQVQQAPVWCASPVDGQFVDGQSLGGQSVGGQSVDIQIVGGQSVDGQSVDGLSVDDQIVDVQISVATELQGKDTLVGLARTVYMHRTWPYC